MKIYKGFTLLSIFLLIGAVHSFPSRKSKPEDLIATDSQIQFSDTNGEFKTSVNTDNSFRAETRSPDGSVKGVYGWVSPGGKPIRVAFKSDAKNGYQTFQEVKKLNVDLPPLPSKLYASNDTDVEVKEVSPKKPTENLLSRQRYRIPQEARNTDTFYAQNDDNDDNFVVLEEDADLRSGNDQTQSNDEDTAVFIEQSSNDYNDEVADPLKTPDLGILSEFQDILSSLEPGTPFAQSNPSATAISGEQGVAQVSPSSSAIVGPGGVAISLPAGQALVGAGGISISAPKSSSQAGVGGVAIAGVSSTSIAGITSGATPVGADDGTSLSDGLGGDPGFFKRHAGNENSSISLIRGAAAPFIAKLFLPIQNARRRRPNQISGRKRYSPSRTSVSGRSSPMSRQYSTQERHVRYEAPDLQSLSEQA
ncbi:unnamed protein product [Lepeophtheirus salmonis]|uniref:(salmon louse) hypothetical protein n=1 Tax=Lepeophtheirus salmonis TaxID=72036 RepID=A0A7R8H178_LEPSM|nr:unnamed protein product [Lepeophtheirus salmonis]CAF2789881.1 unnamed protein product [Lepeophtheirus salmonis]